MVNSAIHKNGTIDQNSFKLKYASTRQMATAQLPPSCLAMLRAQAWDNNLLIPLVKLVPAFRTGLRLINSVYITSRKKWIIEIDSLDLNIFSSKLILTNNLVKTKPK